MGEQIDEDYDDVSAFAQVMQWVRNDPDEEFRTFVSNIPKQRLKK